MGRAPPVCGAVWQTARAGFDSSAIHKAGARAITRGLTRHGAVSRPDARAKQGKTVNRIERRRKAFPDSLGQPTMQPDGIDSRDVWHPLTWRERVILAPVLMDLLYLVTRYTGMRDRLRCPRCTAVGTWKMHGTWGRTMGARRHPATPLGL